MKKLLLTLAFLAGPASLYGYKGADLEKLKTTNACKGCDLKGANLTNVSLGGKDIKDANISGAKLQGSAITWGQILSTKNGKDKNLQWIDFSGFDFSGKDLTGFNLRGARFDNKTNFKDAILKNTSINETMLQRAGIKLTAQQKQEYKNAEDIKKATCPSVYPSVLGSTFGWVKLQTGEIRWPDGSRKWQASDRGYLSYNYYGVTNKTYEPFDYREVVAREFSGSEVPTSPGEKYWIHAAIETNCLKNVKDAFPKLLTWSSRMKARANEPGLEKESPLQRAIWKKNDAIIAYLISQGGELTHREKIEEPLDKSFGKEYRWERGLIE